MAAMWQHIKLVLGVAGWCLALVSWIRVRQLKLKQNELLRRLTRPSRTHHSHMIAGTMLTGMAMLVILAEQRGHAHTATLARDVLMAVGWVWALYLLVRARALRRGVNELERHG